ncbi:uncharacterized protein LOC116341515, partial [Contarinia nasturtii]|uniref:uncharacterized protein LOC116341515 n=1 Tax=Contarinia nasturtii TaxID=265458 RepID=UPI0012D4A7FE
MEMPTMDWRDEMFQMLVAFERQAIHSLGNIKLALTLSGKSINPNFKQYFLQVSNARLEEAYQYFENSSQIENRVFNHNAIDLFGATSSNPNESGSQAETKEFIRKIDCIEIDDSSDEEGISRVPSRLESTSVESVRNFTTQRPITATIMGGRLDQYESTGTSANNYGEIRIGSTIIRERTIIPESGSFNRNHQYGYNDFTDASEDKFIIPAIIENQDTRFHNESRTNDVQDGSAVVNRRTSTVTSNKRPKVVDGTEINMTRKSSAEGASRSTKKSIPSNHLVTKKRFQCKF